MDEGGRGKDGLCAGVLGVGTSLPPDAQPRGSTRAVIVQFGFPVPSLSAEPGSLSSDSER